MKWGSALKQAPRVNLSPARPLMLLSLASIWANLCVHIDRVAGDVGLNRTQLLLLLLLDGEQAMSPSEMAEEMGYTSQRVGMQLPTLVKMRLLRSSRPAPELDQRGVQYTVTAAC
jgi:DNA-binding MarR family transcriptional regulator